MKIREYAESVGFQVVGKITYIGKPNMNYRLYMDEAKNEYWIDIFGNVKIAPARRRMG